jgi:integral membrane protein
MMHSVSEQTTETTEPARTARTARALRWFKVMAILAGLAMFVLIAEMVLKYGYDDEVLSWWSPVHGLIFMVFVFTVWNLGTLLRWSIGRMVAIVLGACIPLVAFWIERRVAAEVEGRPAGSLAP